MKKLSKDTYNQIRSWVYLHGRHLDITRWQYFFENGSKESVIKALSFYQNEDGGFGHGLEPDNSNPNSSPATTGMAYSILRNIDCTQKEHHMIQGIIKYIEKCEHFTDYGWYWSIPSNNHYPCCPWYYFPNGSEFPSDWPPENYINSFGFRIVLKYINTDHTIYKKTLKVVEYRLPLMKKYAEFCTFAKHSIGQSIEADDWVFLIELLREYKLRDKDECERLMAEFLEIVKASANEDVYKQIHKKINKTGLTQDELDLLVDNLSNDKVWNTDGLYGDTSDEKKDQVSNVAALWWPIIGVIDDLKKLKEHDRL